MAVAERPRAKARPVYLNLLEIRQPIPAVVSILHRASGALLFFAGIPALLAIVAASRTPEGFAGLTSALANPLAKLALLVLCWAYLHHLLAGVRHVLQDVHVGAGLPAARRSASLVFALGLLLTLAVAVRLW